MKGFKYFNKSRDAETMFFLVVTVQTISNLRLESGLINKPFIFITTSFSQQFIYINYFFSLKASAMQNIYDTYIQIH